MFDRVLLLERGVGVFYGRLSEAEFYLERVLRIEKNSATALDAVRDFFSKIRHTQPQRFYAPRSAVLRRSR